MSGGMIVAAIAGACLAATGELMTRLDRDPYGWMLTALGAGVIAGGAIVASLAS